MKVLLALQNNRESPLQSIRQERFQSQRHDVVNLCNMYWVSRNLSCAPNFRSVSHLLSINWRKRLREAEQEKDRGNVIRGVRACFRPEDKAGRLVATAGGK